MDDTATIPDILSWILCSIMDSESGVIKVIYLRHDGGLLLVEAEDNATKFPRVHSLDWRLFALLSHFESAVCQFGTSQASLSISIPDI